MRQRRVILILIGVVAAGGIVVLCRREREPEYGGKKLSEWVVALSANPPRSVHMEPTEAVKNIDQIGTNAIPFLVKWISYEPPPWKIGLYRELDKVRRTPAGFTLYHDKNYLLAQGAFTALGTFRAEGKAAIPALSQILNHPNGRRFAARAAVALSAVGKEALPALIPGLTNRQIIVRLNVIGGLQGMGTDARPALSALRDLLKDPELNIRDAVTNALRNIDPEALEAIRRGD